MIFKESEVRSEAIFEDVNGVMHRYLLYKEWDKSKKKACVIMLNPSYADGLIGDQSSMYAMNEIVTRVDEDGNSIYGSMYLVNLFSIIETDSKNLKGISDNNKFNENTDKYIKDAISKSHAIFIFWGVNTKREERVGRIKEMLIGYKGSIFRTIRTDGRAVHISRKPKDIDLKKIDVEEI